MKTVKEVLDHKGYEVYEIPPDSRVFDGDNSSDELWRRV